MTDTEVLCSANYVYREAYCTAIIEFTEKLLSALSNKGSNTDKDVVLQELNYLLSTHGGEKVGEIR